MKVIDPGHFYLLDVLDAPPFPGADHTQRLIFVKREGEGYPGNVGHHEGTNVQEPLRACIDRLEYLDGQIPHRNTQDAIALIKAAVMALEERAAERHGRPIDFDVEEAVHGATCGACGHVHCRGNHAGHG